MTTVNIEIRAATKLLVGNNQRFEVARILRKVAQDIEHGTIDDVIIDADNQRVGQYTIEEEQIDEH